MPPATALPLVENAVLFFRGETAWPAARLTPRQADRLRAAANPSGRPNGDVLQGYLGCSAKARRQHWQIDFAAHLTAQEAALYLEPCALLARNLPGERPGAWWVNPGADPALRSALARLDRFLATAVDAPQPAWSWVDAGWLPDDTLLVAARDDDFTGGVLQSRLFAVWWNGAADRLGALRSFPFPWPPTRPLGALTGPEQDLRFEIGRAARSGDPARIDQAVATAYGWPADLSEGEVIRRLGELNRRRAAQSRPGGGP